LAPHLRGHAEQEDNELVIEEQEDNELVIEEQEDNELVIEPRCEVPKGAYRPSVTPLGLGFRV